MSYNIESPAATKRRIAVTISAEEVNKAINTTVRAYAKDLSLPGFRKGKVPAGVVEKRFADDVLNRATEDTIQSKIQSILADNDLSPINRVKLENEENQAKMARDNEFSFVCFFEVLPAIELPADFSAFTVEVPQPDTTGKVAEALTQRLLQNFASLEDVTEERTPVEGDILTIDVKSAYQGEEVPGLSAENFLMKLRSEEDDKEVEKLVRTIKVGEEVTGSMPCPEDYPDASYHGKEIEITVRLHKISKEILPAMDEEFAKQMGFDDVAKLQVAISSQALSNEIAQIKGKSQRKVLEDVLATYDFELPESMVQNLIANYLMEARNALSNQGVSPEKMIESLAGMRETGQAEANKLAKEKTFLLALASREKLSASEQEINQYIYQMAQETREDFEQLRNQIWQSEALYEVRERVLCMKALDILFSQATRILVDAEGNPVPQEEKAEAAE